METKTDFEINTTRNIEALAQANNEKGAKIQVLEQTIDRLETTIASLMARQDQLDEQFKMVIASRGTGPTTGG